MVHKSVRYVLRRNPQRVLEIENNRLEKEKKLSNRATERTKYLSEHPKASEQTAVKRIIQWVSKLKVNEWVEVYAEDRILKIKIDRDKRQEAAKLDGCYVIKTNMMDSGMILPNKYMIVIKIWPWWNGHSEL